MKELMTLNEARGRLGISTTAIYKLMEGGKIAYYQVGNRRKFDPADIEAYILSTRVPAKFERAGVPV